MVLITSTNSRRSQTTKREREQNHFAKYSTTKACAPMSLGNCKTSKCKLRRKPALAKRASARVLFSKLWNSTNGIQILSHRMWRIRALVCLTICHQQIRGACWAESHEDQQSPGWRCGLATCTRDHECQDCPSPREEHQGKYDAHIIQNTDEPSKGSRHSERPPSPRESHNE